VQAIQYDGKVTHPNKVLDCRLKHVFNSYLHRATGTLLHESSDAKNASLLLSFLKPTALGLENVFASKVAQHESLTGCMDNPLHVWLYETILDFFSENVVVITLCDGFTGMLPPTTWTKQRIRKSCILEKADAFDLLSFCQPSPTLRWLPWHLRRLFGSLGPTILDADSHLQGLSLGGNWGQRGTIWSTGDD